MWPSLALLSVSLGFYNQGARKPELWPWIPQRELSLRVDIDALNKHIYWRNRVHGTMAEAFRLVGWEYELGVAIGPLEFYRAHHSQHILDAQHSFMPSFPLEDQWGIRWTIYSR